MPAEVDLATARIAYKNGVLVTFAKVKEKKLGGADKNGVKQSLYLDRVIPFFTGLTYWERLLIQRRLA